MQWYMKALRQYADFEGRARRTEYWMYALFYAIIAVVALVLDLVLSLALQSTFVVFTPLVALAHIVPSLALTVRRLHDTDRSGWWVLISLVPFGGIVLLVFACTEGTRGPNMFGADPKGYAMPPMGYPQPGQPYVA